MPTKRCSSGCCNSDSRYKDRPHMEGVTFKRFPQLKTQQERCLRWIRLCNRPHTQLNVDKITAYHFVCSKHFVEGSDDPVSACEVDRPHKPRSHRKCRNETSTKRSCMIDRNDEPSPKRPCLSVREDCSQTVKEQDTVLDYSYEAVIPKLPEFSGNINISPVKKSTRKLQRRTAESKDLNCKNCGSTISVSDAELKKLQRCKFTDHILHNDANCFYYTGIPTVATVHFLYSWILPFTSHIKLWDGDKKVEKKKRKTNRQLLSHLEEFLLTLVRLRRGIDVTHLAYQFGISQSYVSRIFIAWVRFLDECFSELIVWPSRDLKEKNMPDSFQSFPKTRVIIDCAEYFTQKPLRPHAQRATFSSYKHANTFKQLIGIMPSGAITFVSKLYAGNISDHAIVKICGILDKIEEGDDVMADRGFNIRHLLLEKRATLNIPAFSHGKCLSLKAVTRSRKIASVRIHVERAIRRMKTFKILSGIIPLKMRFYLYSVTRIVVVLCNLQNRLAY